MTFSMTLSMTFSMTFCTVHQIKESIPTFKYINLSPYFNKFLKIFEKLIYKCNFYIEKLLKDEYNMIEKFYGGDYHAETKA